MSAETRMPSPDATVEPQKCCETCRFMSTDRDVYGFYRHCLNPESVAYFDMVRLKDTCEAWQQRGAE